MRSAKILASEKLEVLSCGVIWAAELAMRKLFGWAMVWASAAEADILVTCGGSIRFTQKANDAMSRVYRHGLDNFWNNSRVLMSM